MSSTTPPPPRTATGGTVGLAEGLNRLAESVDKLSRQTRNRSRIILAAVTLLTVLVGGIGVIAVQNRQTNTLIKDCTVASGKCRQESQKATSAAITKITDGTVDGVVAVVVIVQECARITRTDNDLEACVAKRIAAMRAQPGPSKPPTRPPG